MTLIVFDAANEAPDQADLQAWAEEFGITHPVLSDPFGESSTDYGTPRYTWGAGSLIERGMLLTETGTATVEDAVDWMEGGG